MNKRMVSIFGGVAVFVLLNLLTPFADLPIVACRVISVVFLMLTLWISEAVPIPVTALLPMILFPLLEVMPLKDVTSNYSHPIVYLFFGGFVIAIAMQKWQLHRRIALSIVRKTGTNANGIILGFMLATAFLSMWISNTATTVMMLPIAVSVLEIILPACGNHSDLSKSEKYFALSLMLSIAYAANIGGTATLTGTPPNAIFAGFMDETYGYVIEYSTWMIIGVPFALVLLFLCWWLICFFIYPNNLGLLEEAGSLIEEQYQCLGKMDYAEKAVMVVFVSTALLWIFKGLLPVYYVEDSIIAVAAAVSLFLIPMPEKKGFILDWEDMRNLPWGILLLFGGGLSVAAAMKSSGLVEVIGSHITTFSSHGILIVLVLSLFIVLLLTECMSNLALITVFLPVLAAMSLELGENPLLFTVGATLASSCAFMLPMATPPNAIVFASGYIHIPQMVRAGIIMNIVSIALIVICVYSIISWNFSISPATVPDWAIFNK